MEDTAATPMTGASNHASGRVRRRAFHAATMPRCEQHQHAEVATERPEGLEELRAVVVVGPSDQ